MQGTVNFQVDGVVLLVKLEGVWSLNSERVSSAIVVKALRENAGVKQLKIESDSALTWDSGLMLFLYDCRAAARKSDVELDLSGLPDGAQRLIGLSVETTDNCELSKPIETGFFEWLGRTALGVKDYLFSFWEFLGELILHAFNLVRGKGCLRRKDVLTQLEAVGPSALPIVCLLSFLTGLIIAFIGILQLQRFAADIYVADLVGLALTRELSALMVGIILAGRTGAAFAAQIGSMRVNEELDALNSFGIAPMQFLVLPRVIALTLMIPLLYGFSCLVGIIGGMVVTSAVSNVSLVQFYIQLETAVGMKDFLGGLFKSVVFGVIISLAGCYRGLHCGKDATAVGHAATSAVVTAITWIVISDAIFAVVFNIIGF